MAAALPWTRRRRALTDLATMHQALAVIEIAAHLDLLVSIGELTATADDGTVEYG